jgi:ABC-type uncharacterized transport system permease subunit
MFAVALALVALSGAVALVAAWLRWAALGRADDAGRPMVMAWVAFGCLTAGLVMSLLEGAHRDVSYFILASWAAVGAVLFAGRFLAAPSRSLLLLPIGTILLLLAMAGAWRLGAGPGEVTRVGGLPLIVWIHIGTVIIAMSVLTVAGAAGILCQLAARALKRASMRGLRLPPLPQLERLTERTLVVGTALLSAALATGGAAVQVSQTFTLPNPTMLIGIANLGLLVVALALRVSGRLPRRGLATAALFSLALVVLSAISVVLVQHGIS